MKILNVTQGSPEWLQARSAHFCASDAPAMMNASKYKSRADLLREKAGAWSQEVSSTKQALFDQGHETEATIRPHIESIICDELFPVTATDDAGRLLASMDGLTMDNRAGWEHKLWNDELAKAVRADDLEPHYYWQLEHQLLVTGAELIYFTTSDGTPDKCETMTYIAVPGLREKLLAGWKQFEEDLANYQHVEVLPAAVAEPVMSLPSVSVQVNGQLSVISNLTLFGEKLKEFVSGIDKNPSDDQAFANCEQAIKVLKKAEDALDAAESSALAQVACIDDMVTLKKSLHELSRSNRLTLEKIVKTRKETVRVEIQQAAAKAFLDHCVAINQRLRKVRLPDTLRGNFAEVMKGKKTVTSLRDAVDTELARVKIEANAIAEKMDVNLRAMKELAPTHAFLFNDLQQIVNKENVDFVNLVKLRVSEHEAAEKKKADDLREKIRLEEEEKARVRVAAEVAAPKQESAPVTTVTPSPVRPVTTRAKVQHGITRPSDDEIIRVLMLHYSVSRDSVIEWLKAMDLETESQMAGAM